MAEQVGVVCSIGHEPSRSEKVTGGVKRRQSRAHSKRVDPSDVGVYERAPTHVQRLRPALERLEGRRDIRGTPYFERFDINANFTGCGLNLRYLQYRTGVADITDDCQSMQIGERLAQDFDPLAGEFGGLKRDAGSVAARSRQ